MKCCFQEGQKTKFHLQTARKAWHFRDIRLLNCHHPSLWPTVTRASISWYVWTLSTGTPPTANTTHLYQKKIDIRIEEKKDHWLVKKFKEFDEVVSQKSRSAEKVSNSWTNIGHYTAGAWLVYSLDKSWSVHSDWSITIYSAYIRWIYKPTPTVS